VTTKGRKSSADSFAAATEKSVEAMAEASREAFETMIKAGTEASAGAYEKATAFGATQVGKSSEVYETMTALGKQNLDTATAVMSAVTAGMETYNTRLVGYWKEAVSANLACFEQVMAAKTPQDAAAAQMEGFSRMAERSVAEAVEFNRIAADTVAKATAPVRARFEEAFETAAKSAS
jgi:hypothetical protein